MLKLEADYSPGNNEGERRDLSDMEKARMLDFMIKKFGYTQEALAGKLGKSKAWVSQHIGMLELEKVHPGELQTGEITERQAREILEGPRELSLKSKNKPEMKHTGLVRESLETSNRDLQVLDEYLSGGLYVSGFSSKTSEAQIFEFLPFNEDPV